MKAREAFLLALIFVASIGARLLIVEPALEAPEPPQEVILDRVPEVLC